MAVTSAAKAPASSIGPRSPHVADSSIQPFLQPEFDPAAYLNSALPALSTSATPARGGRAVPLPDLSSQLQTLLNQLNAHTSRLSNALTQLTDEIIRSGSRLAYEVEVLRGETTGLTDTFHNDLKKDIETLAPQHAGHASAEPGAAAVNDSEVGATATETIGHATTSEPEFLDRLRTLTTVRGRLDAVIKTFGSAMQWPMAPSELSLASSLISVSAPESGDDSRSREEKGKEFADSLRSEINALLSTGAEGLEAASARVDELRTLADVWKGTAEEKARFKLVDALQKLVDNKEKPTGRLNGSNGRKPGVSPARGYDLRYGNANSSQLPSEGGSGYGFLHNLRNQMYVD